MTLAAVLLAATAAGSHAQDQPENFYEGKKVTVVIGSSPGGGYDVYGRLIAKYLGKHIPGNPSVVASNMAGAGSNVSAAYIANSAPKDGTYVGALYMGAVVEPLFYGKSRTTHNPAEFNYIGNANTDYDVCAVRSDAPVKIFSDLFKQELVLGASAPGGATYDFPMLLKELLGAKLKIVSGYPGSREVNLALEKGEVQGVCGQSWGGVASMYEPMIKAGTIKLIAQETAEGYPYLTKLGVPLTSDFASTDLQRKVMTLFYAQTSFSRPYVVAKEVPPARVAILRKAFMDTMRDPELVADAQRMGLDVDATAGDVLQKKIVELYSAPKDMVEMIRRIYASN
ncbi:MAG: Tripartite-type tricarboxylate transporter, receptor component TctC [Hyphomicrobiales bacterium]|nr:Tripartite-type tricarboxylate transporter, receptor component TctC [Hyphomicrobiales bacterium]